MNGQKNIKIKENPTKTFVYAQKKEKQVVNSCKQPSISKIDENYFQSQKMKMKRIKNKKSQQIQGYGELDKYNQKQKQDLQSIKSSQSENDHSDQNQQIIDIDIDYVQNKQLKTLKKQKSLSNLSDQQQQFLKQKQKPISPSSEEFQLPPLQQRQSKTKTINNTIKSTFNSLKEMKTNLAYNIKHSSIGLISSILSNRKKVVLQQNVTNKNKKVFLLGNKYKVCYHQEREAFLMKFCNVIWLSYRSNIYGVDTDAGWGCMIRVCQMVLAEVFQRFYKSSKKIHSMTVSKLASKQKSLKQIIEYFMDSPQAYFSLTRICQRGNIKQRWTSSIQIFTIMKDILKQINFQINIQVFSGGIQVEKTEDLQKQTYPILIAVSNRVGVKGIPEHYERHLLELMNNQYFAGCVGGISGQALYLIGHYQGRAIFLDPHYVQSTQSQQYNTSSYFQSQPYSIGLSSLSPSIAMCYYVRNKQQYLELLKILYELQLRYHPNVCIEVCCSQQLKSEVLQKSKQLQELQLQNKRKNSWFSLSDQEFQIL